MRVSPCSSLQSGLRGPERRAPKAVGRAMRLATRCGWQDSESVRRTTGRIRSVPSWYLPNRGDSSTMRRQASSRSAPSSDLGPEPGARHRRGQPSPGRGSWPGCSTRPGWRADPLLDPTTNRLSRAAVAVGEPAHQIRSARPRSWRRRSSTGEAGDRRRASSTRSVERRSRISPIIAFIHRTGDLRHLRAASAIRREAHRHIDLP